MRLFENFWDFQIFLPFLTIFVFLWVFVDFLDFFLFFLISWFFLIMSWIFLDFFYFFGFLDFFNFLDFFVFFLHFFVFFLVTTKCYHGYYSTPKIANNEPKHHKKLFFCPKGKKNLARRPKPSAGARSRPA